MQIGEKIRKKRIEKGISQDWLVNKTGISQFVMSKIESNEKVPDVEQIKKIADALKVSINDLIDIPIKQ